MKSWLMLAMLSVSMSLALPANQTPGTVVAQGNVQLMLPARARNIALDSAESVFAGMEAPMMWPDFAQTGGRWCKDPTDGVETLNYVS
ncbi:hypothetical protein FQN49_005608 [Arthroderma sp. PD_2]|nr:hypothetical protein FQN49_005608 [Arthroderma sp. PD_2]